MAVKNYKEAVEAKIKQAPSLVAALESVAAMYGIPSENIVVDDRASDIRVQGDMIYTPDRPNPSVNTKAIVCAIGAVLDNISQRIDEKLTNYQMKNIENGVRIATQRTADPSKGDVVGRFFDANGGEIIAYSSGLVDMDQTPEALAKVNELRASKQIPDIQTDEHPTEKNSGYFTDDDDIMNGVPMKDESIIDVDAVKNDIPAQIHEFARFVDLYDRLHGSTHMGYDLLSRQGFDYVKPIGVVQEAAAGSLTDAMNGKPDTPKAESKPGSSVKTIDPKTADIQHMKFDNTKILEAIDWFNKAYKESSGKNYKDDDDNDDNETMEVVDPDNPERTITVQKVKKTPEQTTHVNSKKLMKTAEWQMGVKCLEQQFDCKLKVLYEEDTDSSAPNIATWVSGRQWRDKLIISKSKGFQLSGMRIEVFIINSYFDYASRHKGADLFGQYMVNSFLHEIFHNIAAQLRQYDDQIIAVLSSTMMMASSTRNVKTRRILFTNYAEHLVSVDGKKLGRIEKRKMIKDLLSISAIQYNGRLIDQYKKSLDSVEGKNARDCIDREIAALEKEIKKEKKWMERRDKLHVKIFNSIMLFAGLVSLAFYGVGLIILFGMLFSPTVGIGMKTYNKWLEKYLEEPDKEEYYCDMFAGIYNLPNVELLGGWKGKTAKMTDDETLKRLANAEKEMAQLMFSDYPTDVERSYAGYRIAKNALESGIELDPSIKAYLEWVVDNYKNLENANLKENYNSHAFNPEECEDLDAHIQRIIDTGDVTVTESAK